MAKFVKPSVQETSYRSDVVHNNPVNIDKVTQVEKKQFQWYPDNIGIPGIYFHGIDIRWAYPDEASRDKDYEAIVNNNF
jgi:hypothetical protein